MKRHTLTWIDVGNRERLTVVPSDHGSTLTVNLMRVLSDAVLTTSQDGVLTATGATAPSEATFPDLNDTWVVNCTDEGANYQTPFYIPAPLVATCISNTFQFDPANSAWIDVLATLPAMNVRATKGSMQQIWAANIGRDAYGVNDGWLGFNTDSFTWARRTLLWYGVHGRSRLTHLVGAAASLGSDFDLVMNAIQEVSAAKVTHYWEDPMAVYTDMPVDGLYASVNDGCEVYFRDDAGNMTTIIIPAPVSAMFLPDGKTLNVAQANVASFIAQAILELIVPVSGRPVVACVGGHLSKRSVY